MYLHGSRYLGPQSQVRRSFSDSGERTDWRAKFFLPGSPASFECLLNALNDCFTHSGRVTKTYFALCRVNIYIDTRRIDLEKKEGNRVLPFHESGMVAFADSGSDEAAFNRAAAYKNELLRSGLATQTGLSNKAADTDLGRMSAGYLDQTLQ